MSFLRWTRRVLNALIVVWVACGTPAWSNGVLGFYRYPTIHADTIVFTAEGDLWRVGVGGGQAERITTHARAETHAAISPDGAWLAFTAAYEGPAEVYVMPMAGGLPQRLTWEGGVCRVVGWTPEGHVLVTSDRHSGLPNWQLFTLDPAIGALKPVPLAQAAEGVFDASGGALFFTRQAFQGSHTKRYQGGAAQQIWRFDAGAAEARLLTGDWSGTSRRPMLDADRLYFMSDRDGTMNLWSSDREGGGARQLTHHRELDVRWASMHDGRLVYQRGADLWLYDLASGKDSLLDIRLASDVDQWREKWISEPLDYLSAAHLSPNGGQVALTARGQVFVAPVKQGRFVEATRQPGVRYRDAQFLPDGKELLVWSDQSTEVELWRLSADGMGPAQQWTSNGGVLRLAAEASPDGKLVAYSDKNQELWLFDAAKQRHERIASSSYDVFTDLRWSPDSRWLAYVEQAENYFYQIKLYDVATGEITPLSTDRYSSYSPAWDPAGHWIYFLSDRNLKSVVQNPWGTRQPEPFLDQTTRVCMIPLQTGLRSPFLAPNELESADEPRKDAATDAKGEAASSARAPVAVKVSIERNGLSARLQLIQIPAGNYSALAANGERLFFLSRDAEPESKASLLALDIGYDKVVTQSISAGLERYELSANGEHLLLQKEHELYVVDASSGADADLSESQLDLGGWSFSLSPREEWRQMFSEAWRFERDFFYDRNMHGVDWVAMRDRYLPLVDRVTSREELSAIFQDMIGELSALHMYVFGGDFRDAPDDVNPASLGARLSPAGGGWRVDHVYRSDPDEPEVVSPLARPGVDVRDGELLIAIDGVATSSVPHPAALLRNRVGKQARLRVADAKGKERDVIVNPISAEAAWDLRYHEWEYERRLQVERASGGSIGYVHLRAMSASDYEQWSRDFYPALRKQGLIVDVRHNNGGSVESWILEKLTRKAWMWWQPRVGAPYSNMQMAFIGKIVVLCDEWTVSDGEAFCEGFRRLGLGQVIGTRSLGGEIWLTYSNVLVDDGIASAAEFGVYGPEGAWLIEGHGVVPDIEVDNLPHETFLGRDAQLEAAVRHLQEEIAKDPPTVPAAPPYPNKSLR